MDNEITLHWAAEFAQSVLAELMDHTDMAPSMRTQAAHAVDHLETALAAVKSEEAQALKSYANGCAKNPALSTIDAAFSYAWRAALATQQEAQTASNAERSPKDFAIEHAEYMAKNAEHLIDAVNDLAKAEQENEDGLANQSDVDAARETLSERQTALRDGIYEFRKRSDRAALATQQEAQPQAEPAGGDKEDAERYRLVRRGQHWSVLNGIGDILRGEEIDAAVDAIRAARAAQQATGERG